MSELVGETIKVIKAEKESVYIEMESGKAWHIYHMYDCCETVFVYRIDGEIADLLGKEVTRFEEEQTDEFLFGHEPCESHTWTIYTIVAGGYKVVFYWLGESNGYYMETPYMNQTHRQIELEEKDGFDWDSFDVDIYNNSPWGM